jgi:cardiolipin synthase (CMP-forming)
VPGEDRILTVPNLVTFVRLVGVGVFWWMLLGEENVVAAAWLIFAIGWTDWIDGYLARRLNQVSRLGKALDPVADRLMIASAVIGGSIADVVPLAIAGPLIAREVVMAIVAGVLVLRGGGVLDVRPLGKWATFILYGSIPSFYLAAAGVLPTLMEPVAWVTGIIGLGLYWYVLGQYVVDARTRIGGVESRNSDERLDERT